ncbi:hypothetical protein ZOD2009_09895 [Haladaptatus paucihalophilus DX253]|uniref:Uncharacterized protein n=1 Tax=Haladaptatus paucihalophilus DX253 TaxID=797209 RepID=E7QSX1_HALPU|nr:hypothetical protein ZOD2009_09895 [Haladaptatus paucihalophilus DX253]
MRLSIQLVILYFVASRRFRSRSSRTFMTKQILFGSRSQIILQLLAIVDL